jgi:hypothetical protein
MSEYWVKAKSVSYTKFAVNAGSLEEAKFIADARFRSGVCWDKGTIDFTVTNEKKMAAKARLKIN